MYLEDILQKFLLENLFLKVKSKPFLVHNMKNTQLAKLLARTPLSEEDIYNVTVIFGALPEERQIHILNHWEKYVARLIAERKQLDEKQEKEILMLLEQAETILDATKAKEKEQKIAQENAQKRMQREFEDALHFEENKKRNKLKGIAKNAK